MIEIIEHGKKSFTIQCNRCGCKFKYSLEDISYGGYLYCPECLGMCFHPNQAVEEPSPKVEDYTNTPWIIKDGPSTGTPVLNPEIIINCEDK